MTIVIFGDNFSFPEGTASTNRVYTYAKGFIENGVDARVICFNNDYLNESNGIIDGIHYYNPFNQVKRNKYFLKRRWLKLIKYFNTIKVIRQINSKSKIDAIITYTKISSTHLFSFFIARLFNAKLLIENSEHPLRYYQSGPINRVIGKLKLWIELKTNDGILLITQNLIEFYKSKSQSENKLFLVPSTVYPPRFLKEKTKIFDYEYIGYFGSMEFERDKIGVLIEAYSIINEKYDNVHLLLGGMVSKKEENKLLGLIKSLKIESKVHILGYLSREDVIQYIVNAYVLVLVRNNDPFTEASFPSKFTEYISTGNPVISVRVSEISKYITDGENGFLTEPGDTEELSDKLKYVLSNYEAAKAVAKRGRALTDTIFNYNFQSKRIIDFINSI